MTILFFCLNGLDYIGDVKEFLGETVVKSYIDWIYLQQITASDDENFPACGFRSGEAILTSSEEKPINTTTNSYDVSHITMTYSALCSLLILGDDLSRVDGDAILNSIRRLQAENGSFYSDAHMTECDVRFTYSACAVLHILNNWSGINIPKIIGYVNDCQSYEGGFGLNPECEAHGGSTYCALSTLALIEPQHLEKYKSDAYKWLIKRYINGGFQGRPNKEEDMCYVYWIGSSLKLLYPDLDIDVNLTAAYANRAYSVLGGFGKLIDDHPDVLHTSLGIQGLSVLKILDYCPSVDPRIGLTSETTHFMHNSSVFWK